MKIAYYEENSYHTEIMGTFLQYFSNLDAEIVVYNTSDKSYTVNYFQKYCNFVLKPHTELLNDYELYDKIVIGSSAETKDFVAKIGNIDYDKYIFVCHHPNDIKYDIKSVYKNIIVVTPLNCINSNVKYIMPIHNYFMDIIPKEENILTIIGRFKDTNRDTYDLINLINNYAYLNFKIYIFSRAKKFIPKILFRLSEIYPQKLQIFLKINSEKMEHYLKQTKYILPLVNKNSWYHKDRLSGSIAMAYNYNIPLIIDERLRNIYNIEHCVVYTNSLSEIIHKVVNASTENYNILVSKFVESKNKIVEENNKILEDLDK
ncbi:MAG: hypothetical protein Satyrvirus33_7 [Satyrvirus sp.]|uniref:Uncharacterized protein n=1 Tax=Satyrvirus sp. TaxID=2487771 RepID=A0A3G5AEW5_9VIRU|nr:MAG: hypothetical protein Satyrvirus33_7 [Satyrvirus sp.]